jgi:hypothetical protein
MRVFASLTPWMEGWLLWRFLFIWRRIQLFWISTFISIFCFWAFYWRRCGSVGSCATVFRCSLCPAWLFQQFRWDRINVTGWRSGVAFFSLSSPIGCGDVILVRTVRFIFTVPVFNIFYLFYLHFLRFSGRLCGRWPAVWLWPIAVVPDRTFFDRSTLYRSCVSTPYWAAPSFLWLWFTANSSFPIVPASVMLPCDLPPRSCRSTLLWRWSICRFIPEWVCVYL